MEEESINDFGFGRNEIYACDAMNCQLTTCKLATCILNQNYSN